MKDHATARSDATIVPVLALTGRAPVLANFGGDDLRLDRALNGGWIMAGEVRRIATGRLVDLSARQTFLDLLGLMLTTATLWPVRNAGVSIRSVLAAGAVIRVGVVFLQPEGRIHLGLLGITHGVWLFGRLTMLRVDPVRFGRVAVADVALEAGWGAVEACASCTIPKAVNFRDAACPSGVSVHEASRHGG